MESIMDNSYLSSNDLLKNNNDQSINMYNTENCSTDEKILVTIFANDKTNKCKITFEQYEQLIDKLLEMEQIKHEEHLIQDQMNRLNSEKQHVKNLLNTLHSTNLKPRMKNSRYRRQRIQKYKSNIN